MKTLLRYAPVVLVAAGAIGLAFRPSPPAADAPRALIVFGYGDDGTNAATTAAAMEVRNWTVKSDSYSGLYAEAEDLGANWDVVWLLPGVDRQMLYQASRDILGDFVENGGTVIALGVAGEDIGLDLLPGGVDVFPEQFPGSTTIEAPTHPLIDATVGGGVQLTAADLDPQGTGGECCAGPDMGGIACECLATNAAGTVLMTYELGFGHVVMSVFDMLDDKCLGNLLIYTESVVSGL